MLVIGVVKKSDCDAIARFVRIVLQSMHKNNNNDDTDFL